MNWIQFTDLEQFADLKALSHEQFVLIFKHSTMCNVSFDARKHIESTWQAEEMAKVAPYFIDLWAHRNISDAVEEVFGVRHESPQLLLIRNGEVVYHTSHRRIQYPALLEQVGKA